MRYDPETHSYYNDDGVKLPSVTQLLVDLNFVDTQWFTEESRERGNAVHLIVKAHCLTGGCIDSPYLDGYIKFCRECNWKPIIEAMEKPLFGTRYCGTPDQPGYLNGKMSMLDIKSGTISAATGLQLMGYQDLWNEWVNPDADGFSATGLWHSHGRFALQLTDKGKYKLTEYKDKADQYIFRSAVALYWWKRNNKL